VVWYSNIASGAPILAGGLVWAASVFGGTTLYGLNHATGATTVQLHLPRTTEHFATPASGDGKLFIGAGGESRRLGPKGVLTHAARRIGLTQGTNRLHDGQY